MSEEFKYFQRERLEWIKESLKVFGFINRAHIMRKFGLSLPQASADLTLFQQTYPKLIAYDPNAKVYYSPQFKGNKAWKITAEA